jgi:hypothetical protein
MATTEDHNGVLYSVSLSPSGLLVDIEVQQNGERVSFVQIARKAWPAIVLAVDQVMLEATVTAQIENILTDDDDD